ncbi:hypothetical protein niasHT_023078 [Heterodera trifolii]|uniref:Uncharacterized protein n=1 Tax=Heterodera trifolii TaxID=157864 RepID=A0ABD2KFS6_9BILA
MPDFSGQFDPNDSDCIEDRQEYFTDSVWQDSFKFCSFESCNHELEKSGLTIQESLEIFAGVQNKIDNAIDVTKKWHQQSEKRKTKRKCTKIRRDKYRCKWENNACVPITDEADDEKPEKSEDETDVEKPKKSEDEADVEKPKKSEDEADDEKPEKSEDEADVEKPKKSEDEADVEKPKKSEDKADVEKPKKNEEEADVEKPKKGEGLWQKVIARVLSGGKNPSSR